jgi:hypothetical protein
MSVPPLTTPEGLFEYLMAFILLCAALALLILYVW